MMTNNALGMSVRQPIIREEEVIVKLQPNLKNNAPAAASKISIAITGIPDKTSKLKTMVSDSNNTAIPISLQAIIENRRFDCSKIGLWFVS